MQVKKNLINFSIVKRTLPNQDSKRTKTLLSYWDKVINGNEKKNFDPNLLRSFVGEAYALSEIKKLIQNKKYAKALGLMPRNIESTNLVYKIHYDILNQIVFPNQKKLFCSEKLKKYPLSPVTSMQICRYLIGEDKSISLKTIEKQMQREEFKYDYLLLALKDVKR